MALPQTFPATSEGVEVGLRRAAVTMGKPLILYIKAENYIAPEAAGRLVKDGLVCAIKYGAVRSDPADDRSEEHTSELQSLMRISYDVFCLKKKTTNTKHTLIPNHQN